MSHHILGLLWTKNRFVAILTAQLELKQTSKNSAFLLLLLNRNLIIGYRTEYSWKDYKEARARLFKFTLKAVRISAGKQSSGVRCFPYKHEWKKLVNFTRYKYFKAVLKHKRHLCFGKYIFVTIIVITIIMTVILLLRILFEYICVKIQGGSNMTGTICV
jgi:hypothetical protein